MDDEDRQHLEKMLQVHQANLRQLKEQAAQFGIRVPLDLHNSIVHEEEQSARIKVQLNYSASTTSTTVRQPQEQLLKTPNEPKTVSHLRVFLCYSSGDKPIVRDLYRRLQADGFDPWLDEENLLPGQDWEREIRKAVRRTDVVVVCLTRSSITKTGFVQKEIKLALDVADEQPEGAIFLIPLKLKECNVPERLRHWHWVNYYEERGYERLMRALQARATGLELNVLLQTVAGPVVEKSKIRLYAEKIRRELHSNAACMQLPVAQMPFLRDDNYCSLVKSGKIAYLPFSIFKDIIQIYNKTHYMNSYISRSREKDPQLDYNDIEECKTTLLSMIERSIILLEVDLEGILDTLNYDEEIDEGNHFIYALRFELEGNKEWLNDALQTCNYLRIECWEQLRESDYISRLPNILYTKTDETYRLVYILNEQHIKVLREQISEFDADAANKVKQELARKINQLIDLYDRGFPKIGANFKR